MKFPTSGRFDGDLNGGPTELAQVPAAEGFRGVLTVRAAGVVGSADSLHSTMIKDVARIWEEVVERTLRETKGWKKVKLFRNRHWH